MKTFGLATVLALLLAAPAVAATDENIGISIETLLKDDCGLHGGQSVNCRVSDDSIVACGPVVPRAVPRKLRRNPQSKRHLALLQAALSATRRNGATIAHDCRQHYRPFISAGCASVMLLLLVHRVFRLQLIADIGKSLLHFQI